MQHLLYILKKIYLFLEIKFGFINYFYPLPDKLPGLIFLAFFAKATFEIPISKVKHPASQMPLTSLSKEVNIRKSVPSDAIPPPTMRKRKSW